MPDVGRSEDSPVAEIGFPPEWFAGKSWMPGFPQLLHVLTHDEMPGERLFVAGGVLQDGANLIGHPTVVGADPESES